MKNKFLVLLLVCSSFMAPSVAYAQSCSGPNVECPEGQIYDPTTGECADFVAV